MSKFVYKALDEDFNIITDYIEGNEIEEVKKKLKLQGIKLINIRKKILLSDYINKEKKLKYEYIASFCAQMGTIINAGVSVVKGLEIIKEQDKNLNKITENILSQVMNGETLGSSMKKTHKFPVLLTDMVMAGELSGSLDEILLDMEGYYYKEASIRNKIKSALIYPSILLIVTFLMIIFFSAVIFPKMSDIFSDVKDLPYITIILLKSMEYVSNNFAQMLIILCAIMIMFKYLAKAQKIKYKLDKFFLVIPTIGIVRKDVITSRFSRIMAIFTKSTVPLLDALDSVALIVENKYIAEKIEKAKIDIINGNKIADSFEKEKVMDTLVIQMLRIGEESGKLEEMLLKLTNIYDRKVEMGINRIMTLVEPVFTLVIGAFVGLVMVAIALPIFEISNAIK